MQSVKNPTPQVRHRHRRQIRRAGRRRQKPQRGPDPRRHRQRGQKPSWSTSTLRRSRTAPGPTRSPRSTRRHRGADHWLRQTRLRRQDRRHPATPASRRCRASEHLLGQRADGGRGHRPPRRRHQARGLDRVRAGHPRSGDLQAARPARGGEPRRHHAARRLPLPAGAGHRGGAPSTAAKRSASATATATR